MSGVINLFFPQLYLELGYYVPGIIYKKAFKTRILDLFFIFSQSERLNKKESKIKINLVYSVSVLLPLSVATVGAPAFPPVQFTFRHSSCLQIRLEGPVVTGGERA